MDHGFLLAEALKIALKAGIITEEDLFTIDQEVWNKLTAANDQMINKYTQRLRPGWEFEYATKDDAEFYGRNKARYIDPLVMSDGQLQKTSDLVIGLGQYIEEFKQSAYTSV